MRVIEVAPVETAKPQKAQPQQRKGQRKPRRARPAEQRNEARPVAASTSTTTPASLDAPPGLQQGAGTAAQSPPNEAQLRQAIAAEEANRLSRLQMWLGAGGGTLLLGTLFILGRMTLAATRSADVAERALTDLEGPHLYLSADSGYTDGRMATTQSDPTVIFAFKNFGRTPAVLTKLKASLIIAPDLPAAPPPRFMAETEGRYVIGPGETTFDVMKARFSTHIALEDLSPEQSRSLEQTPSPVLFIGQAEYESVFGDTYVFAWAYRPINGRGFTAAGGKALNYRTKVPRA
jgi:hypothetical protein